MVFQDALGSLDPRMSVEQVLDEPLQVHGLGSRTERRERIRELLQAVSLDNSLLSRRPASLSGGQRQRVGIARALALKPKLLVADEPVSALDASVQAQILNLLLDLQERFTLTLLLISHSLAVVHSMCTRVVVMYLGRVVEEAEAEAFFNGPRHPYSSLLLASAPSMAAGAAAGAPGGGEIPSPANRPPGCAFHPRCPRAAERCRGRVPELVEISQGNKVACFLYS
jgi:oligopeptide/dipeptide ABC transporter ATP-binding protein